MHIKFLEQVPIQFIIEIPFDELGKLAAHKEQLLARMCHPIAKETTKPCKFLPIIAGHLADERTLAMHHFIMGKRQHEVFREGIHEGEGHLVVIPFAVNGVKAHILQHVVHPAHVPLVIKAHTAHIDGFGDQRP